MKGLSKVAAIVVRPMVIDDLATVQEIDRKCTGIYRDLTFDDPVRSSLGGDLAISYVAEIDGEVVGFVFGWAGDSFLAYDEVARLGMIGVDPAHRRQGIGRRLVAAFVEECARKGYREIHSLLTPPDPELSSFYARMRFQRGNIVNYVLRLDPKG